jgi:hypothetical protein
MKIQPVKDAIVKSQKINLLKFVVTAIQEIKQIHHVIVRKDMVMNKQNFVYVTERVQSLQNNKDTLVVIGIVIMIQAIQFASVNNTLMT